MKKHRLWTVLAALVGLSMVLGACAPAEPEVIEVTRVVTEKEEVEVEVTREVEVEVPVGGELITLTARCKANPPTEDGRCNNLLAAVVSANSQLEAAGESRRIQLETIQDNKDWGPYKTEFELASDAGDAPEQTPVAGTGRRRCRRLSCKPHQRLAPDGPPETRRDESRAAPKVIRYGTPAG